MNPPKNPSENRRVTMEPPRSFRGSLQRKPLGDCTNTIPRSSQQPSTSVKYTNPSLTSSLKRLVAQTTLKEQTNNVNKSDAASGSGSQPLATNVIPVTRRMSADLGIPRIPDQTTLKEKINDVSCSEAPSGSVSHSFDTNYRRVTRRMSAGLAFPASAPAPIRPVILCSDQGVSEKEFDEPYSVYTTRKRASRRKRNKEASSSSSAGPRLRLDLISSSGKRTHQANKNKARLLKVTPKKKQRTVKQEKNNLVNGAFKDYIEKQKAYFAEVDAFELSEEEITSGSD